jgi:hypothetical protein
MLYDLASKKPITKIPYAKEYRLWMSRMTPSEISAIRAELNTMINSDRIHTAGWMPGSDWTNTPFQPIYEKAAKFHPDVAALCFGLMVYEVFMNRPERWMSGRFEKDGEPIGSRTYFQF